MNFHQINFSTLLYKVTNDESAIIDKELFKSIKIHSIVENSKPFIRVVIFSVYHQKLQNKSTLRIYNFFNKCLDYFLH